ncbi:LOW QUALITY PROTEIN: hypothetical protein GLYMA_09G135600v4 [Glycine max]|uniref:Uncharacterized protein n=1 Tax=Glycine max TaxID=3847 RepID=K7LDQ3_SOYBN|nr:LOW QUALITY PROTEIN: hypothetical protein GLYMA_09G135600v4 [Glycine max]
MSNCYHNLNSKFAVTRQFFCCFQIWACGIQLGRKRHGFWVKMFLLGVADYFGIARNDPKHISLLKRYRKRKKEIKERMKK